VQVWVVKYVLHGDKSYCDKSYCDKSYCHYGDKSYCHYGDKSLQPLLFELVITWVKKKILNLDSHHV
jgi:hypothetical protein